MTPENATFQNDSKQRKAAARVHVNVLILLSHLHCTLASDFFDHVNRRNHIQRVSGETLQKYKHALLDYVHRFSECKVGP